jgi:PAS domain S-box-containing protein
LQRHHFGVRSPWEFAQLLGGTVSVQSTVGQGTTFTVQCDAPACAAATTDPGAARPPTSRLLQNYGPQSSEENGSAAALPPDAPEVLIAEDNAELASYMATLLHGTYRIRIVGDGEEALTQVRQQPPDLLLADVMMPQRDGLSLCREVKSNPATARIPVVLLTALTNRESLLQGWEAGADEYLCKPFHPRELVTRIRTILSAARARKQAEEALKASAQQLRLVIDTAYNAFIVMDSAGRIIEWNPQAEVTFGWSRQEALNRELITTIIPPGYREAHRQGLRRFLATGEGPVLNQRLQLSALHRDGHEFPVELTISVIPWESAYLFAAFIHDITERRRAEEAIRQRSAQLEGVNRELEAFCYSVSHDLRAPLRAIDGFSKALLEDYGKHLDGQATDYLQRVRAASQRMGQLIDDLLKLSRLGRAELRREAVDLSVLARAVADELAQREPQRQATFVIAQVGVVQGDVQLLRIVLENLLGNAWKFTCKHPQARIEFGSGQRNGQLIYFVRDDGAGFEMAYLGKLFGAFQRLHSEKDFPGTGIGLATVQRIIHRHGGDIWAEGAVEQGATFSFTQGQTAHA